MISYAKKERSYFHTFLIYALWFEFSNDFDAQNDLEQIFDPKKTDQYAQLEHSYIKYALEANLFVKLCFDTDHILSQSMDIGTYKRGSW